MSERKLPLARRERMQMFKREREREREDSARRNESTLLRRRTRAFLLQRSFLPLSRTGILKSARHLMKCHALARSQVSYRLRAACLWYIPMSRPSFSLFPDVLSEQLSHRDTARGRKSARIYKARFSVLSVLLWLALSFFCDVAFFVFGYWR